MLKNILYKLFFCIKKGRPYIMANNNGDKRQVNLLVTGTVGMAHLLEPTVVKGNESNETFDLNLHNPVVEGSSYHLQRHPELIQVAIASFQKRIKPGNEQYPDPNVFVSLPARNQKKNEDNVVHFYDRKTMREFLPEAEFAIGTKISAEIQTYDTDNNLTAPYDYRGQRIIGIYVDDKDAVQYYTGNTPEGFTPLPPEDLNAAQNAGTTGTAAPSQPTQSTQTSPFTQGNVAPSEVNPAFGGQTAPNANPTGFGGQTAQNANPTGFGGQPAQPTQQAQPTQPAPAQPTQPQQPADPFGNQQAGQQPTQPQAAQPNGQNANPFGNQQADPFGQQNTKIDDSDLPF